MIKKVLETTLNDRESDTIANPELLNRAKFLRKMAEKYIKMIQITNEVSNVIEQINGVIDDISLYGSIDTLSIE